MGTDVGDGMGDPVWIGVGTDVGDDVGNFVGINVGSDVGDGVADPFGIGVGIGVPPPHSQQAMTMSTEVQAARVMKDP